ncbi:hypothetical protein DLAC_11636 [Tieghemostelium lacteum]|uniref:Uncharacterized protein n=1 Tax=Tieghemostelium lacteum TaxID=361077 RepID=A0A151ZGS2_TIELA|nr:hypothetical protein DLAC_11636 [Tieghemostelium lacteum]|eukprot:KYQ93117.1 hypothetical protein DLAC_11636 [Tieghemostelium lacteum]
MKGHVEKFIEKNIGHMSLELKIQIVVNFAEYVPPSQTKFPMLNSVFDEFDKSVLNEQLNLSIKNVMAKLKTPARKNVFNILRQRYNLSLSSIYAESQSAYAIRIKGQYLLLFLINEIECELTIANEFIYDVYGDIDKVADLQILIIRVKIACRFLKKLNIEERKMCANILYRLFIYDPDSFLRHVIPLHFDNRQYVDEILQHFELQFTGDKALNLFSAICKSEEYYDYFSPVLQNLLKKKDDNPKNNMKCLMEVFNSQHEHLKKLQLAFLDSATASGSIGDYFKNLRLDMFHFSLVEPSSQSSLKTAIAILESSHFRSDASKSASGSVGWSLTIKKSSHILTHDKVEDCVQVLTIFSTQDNQENKKHIETFKDLFIILQSIHSLHIELDRFYHPEFIDGTITFDVSGKSIDSLFALEKKYDLMITNWKTIIQSLPRQLLLLRAPGISSLISLLRGLLNENNPKGNVDKFATTLLRFMKYCITAEVINIQVIKNTIIGLGDALFASKEPTNFLNLFIPKYLESLGIDDDSPPRRNHNETIFTFVPLEKKSNLLNALMQLNQSLPHPRQLFYAHSFKQDIDFFFKIVARFPDETFFVIGIPQEKEKLLNWISKHFAENTIMDLAKVYFVSTEESAANSEIFSFLSQHQTPFNEDWSNFKEQWKNNCYKNSHLRHVKNSQSVSLNLVKGVSGSGKSHYIRSKCKGKQTITVLVRHEFDLNSLVEKISLLKDNKEVFIHFIISPLCSFDVLNQCLYPLIGFGFIFGSKGHFINIDESLSSIFIEIGSPLDSITGNFQNYNDYVQQSIPIVFNLANHENHNMQWDITDIERTCFSFTKSNMIEYPDIKAGDGVSFDDYLAHIRNIIDNKLKIKQSVNFLKEAGFCIPRKNFLSLMHERLQFLDVYYQNLKKYKYISENQTCDEEQRKYISDTMKTFLTCEELYNLFLLESIQLSDPHYSSVDEIWKNPPLVTSRSILYSMIDDEVDIKPIVDFFDFSGKGNVLPINKQHSLFSLQRAKEKPKEFKTAIFNSFNITTRTYIINDLSNQYGFVLTNELAHRLVILNNKIKTQRSLILTGDTGVGKTFILIFYSLLINASNNAIPDIIFDIKETVNKILKEPYYKEFKLKPITIDYETTYGKIPDNCNVNHIIDAIKQMYNYKPNELAVVVPPPNPQVARANLFSKMEQSIKKILLENQLVFLPNTSPLNLIKSSAEDQKIIIKLEQLVSMTKEICSVKFQNLFHRIIMHKKFSSKEFKIFVLDIVRQSIELSKIDISLKIVVFIDEFNTSPDDTLALISEIFIDGTLDGEGPLPENIFWIGAMNPLLESMDNINYTGKSNENNLAFFVQEIPPSMKNLFFDFGTFQVQQEENFVDTLFNYQPIVEDRISYEDLSVYKKHLRESILIGQRTLRNANQSKTHVSIRDIMRSIDIYKFFKTDIGILILRCCFPNIYIENDSYLIHWLAIICSFYMTYVYRTSIQNTKRDDMISKFEALILSNNVDQLTNRMSSMKTFQSIYSSMCDKGVTNIPVGIARTDSLQLNIFFTIVSIGCRIPLLIIGPPGCSKTLSFSIVLDNINTHKDDKSSFYSLFPNAVAYRYQCSEHTTDVEVKSTLDRAIEIQKFVGAAKENRVRCIIHFDEAGLVDERLSPMKVMHDYLDKLSQKTKQTQANEDISIIILSNKMLDAAKANRMLILLHPPTISEEDDKALVKGCLFGYRKNLSNHENFICNALSNSYKMVNQFSKGTKENLFHQRDFVFFLRHLQRSYEKFGSITSEGLLNSLERHFNGIPLNDFQNLVTIFFRNLNLTELSKNDNTILRIQESLQERLYYEDPNTSAFRYLMLIDPSENETSLMILKELGIKHKVIRIGGFEKDHTLESLASVVDQIKNEMAVGGTIVLVNTTPIYSSLYSVFNRYFHIINGTSKFFAKVSFGNHSIFCSVHPEFKIIIHMPKSQLKTAQLPLLNRFEKYYLTIDQLLNHILSHKEKSFFELLLSSKDFVGEFHHNISNNSLLFGYSNETISSLVYSIAKRSIALENPINLYKLNFNDEIEVYQDQSKDNQFRNLNCKLLQIARPESIFKCKSLPKSYIKEYLINQEHFNCLKFLHNLYEHFYNNGRKLMFQINKWVLYTRTSLIFHRLKDNDYIDTFYQILSKKISPLISKDTLKIIQLHNIDSTNKCNDEMKSFHDSKSHTFLMVFADLTLANQNQINCVMESFDNITNKQMIIICHFPPEYSIHNQPKIQSNFLNNTEFLYIDSFGMNGDNPITASSLELVHPDIRALITHSYGFSTVKIDPSLYQSFQPMFYQHLRTICEGVTISTRIVPNSSNERIFYADNIKRFELVEGIFKKNEIWLVHIIDQFIYHCSTQNILTHIITNISTLINTGHLVRSFFNSIIDSLTSYFYPVISEIYQKMFNNRCYSVLEAIHPQSLEQELISLFIKGIKLPVLSENTSQRYNPISLSDPLILITPKLPLFESISMIFDNYFQTFISSYTNQEVTKVLVKFDEYIQSLPIKLLQDLLSKNEDLNFKFRFDYFTRVMKIEEDFIEMFNNLLVKVLNAKTLSVSQLFVFKNFFNPLVLFIRANIRTIIRFKMNSNIYIKNIENLILTYSNSDIDSKKFKNQLTMNSFNAFGSFINRIMDADNINIGDIVEWVNVTRELFNISPIDSNLLNTSDSNQTKDLIRINSLYHIFLFIISNYEQSNLIPVIKSLKYIRYHDTRSEQSIIKLLSKLHQLDYCISKEKPGLSISLDVMLDIIEPLALAESNLNELLKLCSGIVDQLPNGMKVPPVGWFTNILSVHLPEQRIIISELSSKILKDTGVLDFVTPNTLSTNKIIGEFINCSLPPTHKSSKLADCLYYLYLTEYQDPKKRLTIIGAIEERKNLILAYDEHNLPMKIRAVALETWLIGTFCDMVSREGKYKEILNDKDFTTLLKSLFKVGSNHTPTIEEYQNRNNQLLFINKIDNQHTLFQFLQDKVFLDSFSLNNLYLGKSIDPMYHYSLPFVYLEGNAHLSYFMKVKTTLSTEPLRMKELVNESTTPILKGLFRSSLFILLYQDYIATPFHPIKYQKILDDKSLKTHFELEPVLGIYEKIINNSFGTSSMDKILKRNDNKSKFDTTVSHMIINFVAMSLGSNDKSYLFNLTRDPLKVAGAYFPACDVGHMFRDYGMIYNDNDITLTMGGNIQMKYIVSSTSWFILAYTISVYPKHLEILNDDAITQFSCELKEKTSINALVSYVFEIGLSSIEKFKKNQENLNLHLEPCQFISEYIYVLWKHSYEFSNASMKSIYCSDFDVLVYEEKVLIPIINDLYLEYPSKISTQIKMLEKQSVGHANILKLRQEMAKIHSSPIYSPKFTKDFIYSNLIPEFTNQLNQQYKTHFTDLKNNMISEFYQGQMTQEKLKIFIEFLQKILTKFTSNESIQSIKVNINGLFFDKVNEYLLEICQSIPNPFKHTDIQSMCEKEMPMSVYPLFLRSIHEVLSVALSQFEETEKFTPYKEPYISDNHNYENAQDLKKVFNIKFYQHLNKISVNLFIEPSNIEEYQLEKNERLFYTNKSKRLKMAQTLFESNEIWVSQIIDQFVEHFGLKRALDIFDPNQLKDFIFLQTKSYPVFNQYIEKCYSLLFNYRSINTLKRIKPQSPEQQLVSKFIEIISIPKNSMILKQFQLLLSDGYSILPLYDTISKLYQKYFIYTLDKLRIKSPKSIQENFYKFINQSSIKDINELLDSHQGLNEHFRFDYLTRTMKIDKDLFEVINRLLLKLNNHKTNSVTQLFVSNYFFSNLVFFIISFIFPIINLKLQYTVIKNQFIEDIENSILINFNDAKNLKKQLILNSFNALEFFIDEILSSEIFINDIVGWMNATREMFNRSSVQQTLLMISDFKDTKDNIEKHQKSIIKINTLHQIFLFISSKFQNQHFTPLIKSLKQINYHYTLAELSILKVFQQLLQLNQLLPKESHDLFIPNQVLLDIVEPLALMKNETNLNELLKLCNGTDSITNDSASLPIPEGWYTSMISSQLQESREQVMKTSAEIFATNNISEFVSPLLSNNIIDSFLNFSLPQDYKSSQLANCLYHSVVEGYEDPKKNLTLLDIIFERSNLMEKFKKDPKNNLPMKINSIALETFLIEKFCEILTNDGLTSVILNDKVFTTLNSLFKVDESQRSSAEDYQNRSNQLLFINKIGDQQTLFNLLQDKKFLDSFSLGNLYMDHTLDFSHQFKVPFVYLESNIHYPFFMKVKTTLSATPLNMSELVNETETPILKGLFRSSLLILLFQDYNEEKPLKQYQSILTDEKLKTHFELEPVLRIYEKIINNSFGDNLLDNLLKKDANKSEFETSISHMVINFVAMSLGSNDKSYLFNLTRDPLKVAGKYFPACDAGHKFRDYGMKHNDKDFTSTMGGNIQKKHIVSSTSWLILAYAISVYPEYLKRFNDKQLDFSPQLENKISTNELVSYVFNFGLSSIKEFKNNPENLNLHLEPCQFISEYIYDVWEHSYQLNENTSMKSFYCSENEALDYENQILIPIINKIYDEYPKRNELILQMIEKKSKQHAEYLKIRQELAKSFSSPIYSFRFIKDFITSNNDSKLKALVFFLNQVDMLSISEYIPNLINFLKICSHHFQKYLSADQLNWNFPQIHKYLLDQNYDTLSLTKLENSWRELKKIWVLISNRIRDYIYPRSTPKINDETPIKDILPLSEANTGAILDIINEWIKIQSKTMRILDEIEDENLSESMKNVISSFDGSKCDIMDMDIENTENKFSLLGSNLTPNAFESFLKENISYYQTNYRDQFKPDLMEIQNKLMITVLSGKMYHSINSNSLSNLPFTKSEIDELTITIEDFSLPIDQELEKSIEISSDREGTNTSDNHNQDNIDDYTPIDAFYVNEENTEVIDAIYQPCSTIHITPLDNDVNGLRRSIYHWIRYCPEFNNLIFSQTGPLQKSIAKFQKEAQSTTHLYLNIQNLDNLLLECMELSNDQPIDKPIGLLVKLLDKISEIHPEALKYFTWTITSFCVICNTKCNHPDIYVPLDSFSGIVSNLEPVYLSTILNEKLLVGNHIKQPCGHKLTYEVESHPKYIFVPIDRIEEPSLHNILQPKKLTRDFRIVLNETISSPQNLKGHSIKIHSVLVSDLNYISKHFY